MIIILKPVREVNNKVVEKLKEVISDTFGCVVEIAPSIDIPAKSFNKQRNQYLASLLLSTVKKQKLLKQEKVLGITDVDLYVPELNYVFGLAGINGCAAIISLIRLRQEYYNLPPDNDLFLIRAVKEAVHELGHSFGLSHCSNNKCVMHFSNSLHDTDIKQPSFCRNCRPKLVI